MTAPGRYATVINCMDGRFQIRVIDHLQTRFGARNIDNITAPGAVKHLAGRVGSVGETLLENVATSVDKHDSRQVAVVAHGDCVGNPVPDSTQKNQLREARTLLTERFPSAEVLALFLDPRTGFERIV
jgi:carbonic anhydrase